jgi:NAD(P)-dependent dehydrogenase (short-subunit alcohol dehydrogenase family)
MRQCLITGGGSKFGQHLTQVLLNQGFHVHLVTSSVSDWNNVDNVTVIPVDWKNINLSDIKTLIPHCDHLDLIFFNHNASSLSQQKFQRGQLQSIKDWQQSYFVACQLPFYLIQLISSRIGPDTKVAWMLSKLITNPIDSQAGFADYIGNKFTNACIMKSFAQSYPACFLGIHPDSISEHDTSKARDVIDLITHSSVADLNGRIFSSQGKVLTF